MRIRFLRLRALQLSLCLCCLSSASNAIAQTAQGGVAPGRSYSAPSSSTLLTSSASVSGVCTNADLLETDLWTYSLAANTLNEDGKTIRIVAWGDYGATANTKIVHLYAGGVALTPATALANNGTSWVAQGWVTRTAAAQELGKAVLLSTGGNPNGTTRLLTSDTTATIPLKVTGTNGTAAASDICFRGVTVSLEQTTTNNIVTSTGGPVANPILLPNGTVSFPSLSFAALTNTGIYRPTHDSGNVMGVSIAGTEVGAFVGGGFRLLGTLRFNSTAVDGTDTTGPAVLKDAANVLSLENSTAGQTFRIYNTKTDASNYERTDFSWAANAFTIKTTQAGTGTGRSLTLDGSSSLNLSSAGTSRWQVTSAGNLFALADNTYDIGTTGANRPANVFVANVLQIGNAARMAAPSGDGTLRLSNGAATDFDRLQFGGTAATFPALKRNAAGIDVKLADDSAFALLSAGSLISSGNVQAGSSSTIKWGGRASLTSPGDGQVTLFNAAQTDFTMLQFGGTTSAFPAIKRSGALFHFRLADDSGYADAVANNLYFNASVRPLSTGNVLLSATAPTISSGFGTTPAITTSNGTAAFLLNVGTGGTATSGVIGLPAAANSWNCYVTDTTAAANHTGLQTLQTSATTTTATIESQNSAGAATAWAASTGLRVSCFAY